MGTTVREPNSLRGHRQVISIKDTGVPMIKMSRVGLGPAADRPSEPLAAGPKPAEPTTK